MNDVVEDDTPILRFCALTGLCLPSVTRPRRVWGPPRECKWSSEHVVQMSTEHMDRVCAVTVLIPSRFAGHCGWNLRGSTKSGRAPGYAGCRHTSTT